MALTTHEKQEKPTESISEKPYDVMKRFFGPAVRGFYMPFPKKPETLPSGAPATTEAFSEMRKELARIDCEVKRLMVRKDDLSLETKKTLGRCRRNYATVTADRLGLAIALLDTKEVIERLPHGKLMRNAANGLLPIYKALSHLCKAMRRLDEQRQLVAILHHSTTDHGGEELFGNDIVEGARGLSRALNTILNWAEDVTLPQGMDHVTLADMLRVSIPDPIAQPQELPAACGELLKKFYGARTLVLSRIARIAEAVEMVYGLRPTGA